MAAVPDEPGLPDTKPAAMCLRGDIGQNLLCARRRTSRIAIAAFLAAIAALLCAIGVAALTCYLMRGEYKPTDVFVLLLTLGLAMVCLCCSLAAAIIGMMGMYHCLSVSPSFGYRPAGLWLAIAGTVIGLAPTAMFLALVL